MTRVLMVTAAVAAAALVVLVMADGVVEIAGYELLVLAAGGTAVFAMAQLKPRRAVDRAPLIAAIGTAHSRRLPPQLVRVEWLVEFSGSTSFDAEYRLLPELRDIARRRLHRSHRIDLADQPDAARELVGAVAWSYLDPNRTPQRTGGGIPLEDLDELVAAIESL